MGLPQPFIAWAAGLSTVESGDPNALINAIGIAFGQVLVTEMPGW